MTTQPRAAEQLMAPPAIGSRLAKSRTGIIGLDEITHGGLPAGRPTLLCGGAGSGKTLLATEFLVRGATEFGEAGVLMSFEESAPEIIANVRSLGFDLETLITNQQLVIDHVHVERSEIEETGDYDLEGLFIRLGHAIDLVGASRVALDTIEALFAGLPNHAIVRSELRRLFRWLKDKGVTAVITAERGDNTLTRYGLEEYVADCVIVLDQRVTDQIATRRLWVMKYRGSAHGSNQYPFLIGSNGLSVMPITSLRLDHPAPAEAVPTGIAQLDNMLGMNGVYRGSSVLVSGSPGTGKSTVGAAFVNAACGRGERAVLFAYEESAPQMIRNMRSVGIDLAPWVEQGQLLIHTSRPTLHGLEQHLVTMYDIVNEISPTVVVVDPISNFSMDQSGSPSGAHTGTDVKPMLMRLIDLLKQRQITAVFTSLTSGGGPQDTPEDSQVGVSSLMDVWLLLRNVEHNGERNRTIFVLKARGMAHSNQVREFVLSGHGIDLVDVYLGADGVLTGTARAAREEQELAASELRKMDHEQKLRRLQSKTKAIAAQIAALEAEAEADRSQLEALVAVEAFHEQAARRTVSLLGRRRWAGGVKGVDGTEHG